MAIEMGSDELCDKFEHSDRNKINFRSENQAVMGEHYVYF
jgi:hypothetical protein